MTFLKYIGIKLQKLYKKVVPLHPINKRCSKIVLFSTIKTYYLRLINKEEEENGYKVNVYNQ